MSADTFSNTPAFSSKQGKEGILDSYKPIDPVERGALYRKEGWTTFDPKAEPYRPSQAEIERIRREHDIAA